MFKKLQFYVSLILLILDIFWVKTAKQSELELSDVIIKPAYFEKNSAFKIIIDNGSNKKGVRLIKLFKNSIIITDTLSNYEYEYDFK